MKYIILIGLTKMDKIGQKTSTYFGADTTFDSGASGRRYIYQTNGKSEKKHGINDGSFATSSEGRIYEKN